MAAARGSLLFVVVLCLASLGDAARTMPRRNQSSATAAVTAVEAPVWPAEKLQTGTVTSAADGKGKVAAAGEGFLARWWGSALKRPAMAIAVAVRRVRSCVSPGLQSLFAGLSFAAGVKFACMAANIFYTVSPLAQVQGWESKGCTGNVDAAPYVMMAFNGCQWCFYGFAAWQIRANDGFLVLVYANWLGAMLGFYYTCSFSRHCRNLSTSGNLKQYVTAGSALLLLEVSMWLTQPHERALVLHSLIASFCSFMGALSVLAVVPTVTRTGDAAAICGPLCAANLIGGMLWACWGSMMQDFSVLVPNTFAACASGVCLCIKAFYASSSEGTRDLVDKLGDKTSSTS